MVSNVCGTTFSATGGGGDIVFFLIIISCYWGSFKYRILGVLWKLIFEEYLFEKMLEGSFGKLVTFDLATGEVIVASTEKFNFGKRVIFL